MHTRVRTGKIISEADTKQICKILVQKYRKTLNQDLSTCGSYEIIQVTWQYSWYWIRQTECNTHTHTRRQTERERSKQNARGFVIYYLKELTETNLHWLRITELAVPDLRPQKLSKNLTFCEKLVNVLTVLSRHNTLKLKAAFLGLHGRWPCDIILATET